MPGCVPRTLPGSWQRSSECASASFHSPRGAHHKKLCLNYLTGPKLQGILCKPDLHKETLRCILSYCCRVTCGEPRRSA